LEGGAALVLTRPSDKALDIGGGERRKPLGAELVVQMGEELGRRGDVLPDGDRRQAPQLLERDPVDLGQAADPRDGGRGEHEAGARPQESA
jgi:hypothetical protein